MPRGYHERMKIYEVGGAVRDALLGDAVDEHDWVVVGARPAELEQLGFRRVGKDFPVFIHPDTGEEYALARRERKIAPGHSGFEFDTTASVTLEEDLGRRDLTINAIARDADGTLIDPHGGLDDLRGRVLRHISICSCSRFSRPPRGLPARARCSRPSSSWPCSSWNWLPARARCSRPSSSCCRASGS